MMFGSKGIFRFVLFAGLAASPLVCIGQTANAGAVAGTVTAADGSPIAGASVTVSAVDAPVRVSVSASDGTFLVRDLPSGSYTVRVTSPAFAVDEESVSVAVGRTTSISVHLAVASTQQTVNVTAAPV